MSWLSPEHTRAVADAKCDNVVFPADVDHGPCTGSEAVFG